MSEGLEILNSLTLWSRFCGIDGGNRHAAVHEAVHEKQPLNVCTNRGRCAGGERFLFCPKSKVRFTPKRSTCWSESMRERCIVATLRLRLGLLNSNDPEIVQRSHFDDKCCSVIVQKSSGCPVGQQIPRSHVITSDIRGRLLRLRQSFASAASTAKYCSHKSIRQLR